VALRLFWRARWLILACLLVPYMSVLYAAFRATSLELGHLLRAHLGATASLGLFTACIAGGIGTMLGLALALLRPNVRYIALCTVAGGILLPIEFHGMVWLAWLGTGTPAGLRAGKGGIHAGIEWLLEVTGVALPATERDFLAALLAASLVHGLWGGGIVALGTAAAAARVPQELLDAAAIETNSPFRLWWHVVLPTIWPATLALVLVAVSAALTEVAVVDLLQLRTLADDVYVAFQLEANPDRAFATALPLIGLATVLAGALLYLTRRGIVELVLAPQRTEIQGSIPWSARAATALLVLFGVATITAAPYAGILFRALPLTTGTTETAFWARLVNVVNPIMATASVVHRELAVSLIAGSLAALLATVAAFAAVYGIEAGYGLLYLAAVAAVVGATPGPVLGLGVNACAMWLGPAIYDSYVPLVWGMSLRCLPVCLLVACAWRIRVDPDLVDMTRLDSVNPFAAVWHVWWPLSRNSVIISVTLGLLITIGDVGTAVITAPPGIPPVPVRVFSLLHYGLDEYVAGIAFWLVATVAAIGSFLLVWAARHEKTHG